MSGDGYDLEYNISVNEHLCSVDLEEKDLILYVLDSYGIYIFDHIDGCSSYYDHHNDIGYLSYCPENTDHPMGGECFRAVFVYIDGNNDTLRSWHIPSYVTNQCNKCNSCNKA